MAIMHNPMTLTGAQNMLAPGVWACVERVKSQRGSRVERAEIYADMMTDALYLHVKHHLFDRRELEDQSYMRTFAARVGGALGLKEPEPAKSRRVERRQLMWRGEQSRRSIPRPVKKLKRAA